MLLAGGIATLLVQASATAGTPCGSWEPVDVPSFGTIRDVVVDADAFDGPVHLLVAAKDNLVIGGDQHFHVLRRNGEGWTDLGEPDVAEIEAMSFGNEGVVWTALAVTPDGSVWIGGEFEALAQVNRGYQRPVFARWQPGTGWSAPEPLVLHPVTEYPHSPRGGTIYDIDAAPDGSVFASGISSGWGGLSENNGSIPMLLRNAGTGWQEVNVPDRDWPGSRGVTDGNGVIAFGADHAIMAGRHPGGSGVGQGALIATYTPADGPEFVETPAYGGRTGHVANDLDGSSPSDIWVVGEGSVVGETALFMRFDGSDWTMFPSPFTALTGMQDLAMATDGTGWAFQTYPGPGDEAVAYFDGSAWTARPFRGADSAEEVIYAASRSGDGALWAVGALGISDVDARTAYAARLSPGPCGCAADLDGSGSLDLFDILGFFDRFGDSDPAADFTGDGSFDLFDILGFFRAFGRGCE